MWIHGFIIEPWAIARLPLQPTHHAELCGTAASHVVAALFELYHSMAAIASLPAFFFRRFHECLCFWIFGAFSGSVHLLRADGAYSGLALFTASNLAPMLHGDVMRFDPGATFPGRTVYSILRFVLLKFTIPQNLELVVEELLDMLEVYMLICAASWRHVSRVRHGHCKDALQARVAHAMFTW